MICVGTVMQPTLTDTPMWKQLLLPKVLQTQQSMTLSVVSELRQSSHDDVYNMNMTKTKHADGVRNQVCHSESHR